MVIGTIGWAALLYWGGTGLVCGGLQSLRGAILAVGCLAEGRIAEAAECLNRGLSAPASGIVHETRALLSDCRRAAEAIERSAAPLARRRAVRN